MILREAKENSSGLKMQNSADWGGGSGRQRQAQAEEGKKIIGSGTGFVFGDFIEREVFMVGGI